MKFMGFVLDKFQERAINELLKGNNVLVCAPTGTGKTLIAEYLINIIVEEIKQGEQTNAPAKIIYTSPLKALSNQKYRDFRNRYGESYIGLVTGDVVINDRAPVLIMTTEIYRNMLFSDDTALKNLHFIIFDELHYLDNNERGTVWEESIILSPKHVQILGLSATISNAKEIASWISQVHGKKCVVITENKRAVPLNFFVYNALDKEILPIDDRSILSLYKYIKSYELAYKKGKKKSKEKLSTASKNKHYKDDKDIIMDLVKILNRESLLPALIFSFNRKNCEQLSRYIARKKDFTTDNKIKAKIINKYNELIKDEIKVSKKSRMIREIITHGIGFHHAGLLPKLKELIEVLFSEGYLSLIFTTETFALGINMPAKTVVINGLMKYDGISFRYINTTELLQMGGRAGRRGIDDRGSVIILPKNRFEVMKLRELYNLEPRPIRSRFVLSYNTMLNLINNYDEDEFRISLLTNSFAFFEQSTRSKRSRHRLEENILNAYYKMKRKLLAMGYITHKANGSEELTEKGLFGTRIYINELLVCELFNEFKIIKGLGNDHILALLILLSNEEEDLKKIKINKGTKKKLASYEKQYYKMINLISKNDFLYKNLSKKAYKKYFMLFYALAVIWLNSDASYEVFNNLLQLSKLDEGDLIRLFRMSIDLCRQILNGYEIAYSYDYEIAKIKDRIRDIMSKVDRGIIGYEV